MVAMFVRAYDGFGLAGQHAGCGLCTLYVMQVGAAVSVSAWPAGGPRQGS